MLKNYIVRLSQLTSCTWKYGCQNQNYVQGESIAQYQVKEETVRIEEKSVDRKVLKVNERIRVWGDAFQLSVTTTSDRSIYPSGTEMVER